MFVQRDEGASVMGLTLAQYGEITYKNGRVEQGNFNDFQLARINESPTETRVRIVEHGIDVPASGVGEPGVPPLANRQSALDLSSDGGQRVRPPPKTLPAPSGPASNTWMLSQPQSSTTCLAETPQREQGLTCLPPKRSGSADREDR